MRRKEQLDVALQAVTYKPGWEFEAIHHIEYDIYLLIVDARVESVEHAGVMVHIKQSHSLPVESMFKSDGMLDEKMLWLSIEIVIDSLERHEKHEWLKVDGIRLHDPHERKIYPWQSTD